MGSQNIIDSEKLSEIDEPVSANLGELETQLLQLLDELRLLQLERQSAKRKKAASSAKRPALEWDSSLENFLLKATVIRRMLSQFRGSDLSTRRYLRRQLDEEFEQLKANYSSLTQEFTDQPE